MYLVTMKDMPFESPRLHSKVELLGDDHRGVCLVTAHIQRPAPVGKDVAIIVWRSLLLYRLISVLLEYLHLREVQLVARLRDYIYQLVLPCNLRDYLIPSGLFPTSNHDTIPCGRALDGHSGLSTH